MSFDSSTPPDAPGQRHRMLENLISDLPGLVYRCANDADWTAQFFSDGARELTGYSAHEFSQHQRHFGDLIFQDDRSRVWDEVQTALAAHRRFSLTYRIVTAGGVVRWVKEQGCGVFGADGMLEAIEGFVTDATEHVAAETAIRESEQRYRELFAANPQPMWVYDLETLRFLAVNDAAIDRYGFSRDEFLTMTIADIRPAEDVPRLLENVHAVTAGIDRAGVWRHRRKDQTIIEVEITSHTLDYAGHRAELVLANDVTERRRTEAVMRLQSSALNAAANAIMITDRAGAIEWVNPAWTALTGYTLDEARGKTPRILKSGAQDLAFYERFWKSVLRGDSVQGELINRRKDGSIYYEYETITPVTDPDGKISHFIAVKQDITHRKQADDKLRRLNRTYAVLSEINQLIVRAQSRDEVLTGASSIAVDQGGFRLAWIGLLDGTSNALKLAASEGADATTTQVLANLLEEPVNGCAITMRALASGTPALCNDIACDPVSISWRQLALDRGYRSMASFPIQVDGRTLGTFNLYAPQIGFFDEEEIRLLGELAGDIGFALEIHERELQRKMAEKSLRESEQRFRTVLETLALLGLMLDHRGRILLCSDHLLALTGWSREEVIGQDWFSRFVPPEETENARLGAFLAAVERKAIPDRFEDVILTRTGERRLVAWNNTMLRGSAGEILAVMSLGEDITERRRAEQQVRELAEFPRLNHNPVLAFSADGTLTYANPAADELARKIGVKDIAILLPKDARELVRDCLGTQRPHLRVLTRHGPSTVSWSFHPIAAANVVHCYAGDITERLALEEQLRQSQKMDAIGRLAGGIAHDFNNLLTVIQGNAAIAREPSLSAQECAEALREIDRAAERSAALTRQLLAFSRRQVMQVRTLDINEAVTSTTRMLQRLIGEDINLQLILSPRPVFVRADPGMIDQILMNLAVNARDAMPACGRLTIATELRAVPRNGSGTAPRLQAILRVSDTGCGIHQENLSRIFEPFFTTKEPGKGTGLGLATVFGIVKQHNGSIDVSSVVGEGSSFEISLPLDDAPHAPAVANSAASARASGAGETILVVEDEPSIRRLAVLVLERLGYTVLQASNGEDALKLIQARPTPIDLVLTDMIMPGDLTGQDLSLRMRAQMPALKTIIMSGYTGERTRTNQHLQEGFNFLPKPFGNDQLAQCVRARLDSA